MLNSVRWTNFAVNTNALGEYVEVLERTGWGLKGGIVFKMVVREGVEERVGKEESKVGNGKKNSPPFFLHSSISIFFISGGFKSPGLAKRGKAESYRAITPSGLYT